MRNQQVTDLEAAAASLKEHWSPKVVGCVNGQYVKVAKLRGDFIWHRHEDEDELFLVIKGELTIRYRGGKDVRVNEGEMHIVPKGVEHNPYARRECLVALIEPVGTLHTGGTPDPRQRSIEEQVRGSEG